MPHNAGVMGQGIPCAGPSNSQEKAEERGVREEPRAFYKVYLKERISLALLLAKPVQFKNILFLLRKFQYAEKLQIYTKNSQDIVFTHIDQLLTFCYIYSIILSLPCLSIISFPATFASSRFDVTLPLNMLGVDSLRTGSFSYIISEQLLKLGNLAKLLISSKLGNFFL